MNCEDKFALENHILTYSSDVLETPKLRLTSPARRFEEVDAITAFDDIKRYILHDLHMELHEWSICSELPYDTGIDGYHNFIFPRRQRLSNGIGQYGLGAHQALRSLPLETLQLKSNVVVGSTYAPISFVCLQAGCQ